MCRSNEAEIIWHDGSTGGFRSYLGFNPKAQLGIVILSNSTEDWLDEFASILLDPDYKRPLVNQSLSNDSNYLRKFTGSYEATFFPELSKEDFQIIVHGKRLACVLSDGEVKMLYPTTLDVFGMKQLPDGKVRFNFDGEGNVSKVEALFLDGTIFWEAVPKSPSSIHI